MEIRNRAAIDIGGTKLLVAVWGEAELRTRELSTGSNAAREGLVDAMRGALLELGGEGLPLGIAVPGLVDESGRIIDCDVLPALTGWRPQEDFPSVGAVLNDGEAALVRAAADAAPEEIVAVVGAGTAVAAALRIAGHSVRHFRPTAVELGYVPFGREGRLDDYAAGYALLSTAGMTAPELHAALQRSDLAAMRAVAAAGEALGLALALLVNLLQPHRIALYGGTLRYEGYLDAALAAVKRSAHPALLEGCKIGVVAQPELAVAAGAALATAGAL